MLKRNEVFHGILFSFSDTDCKRGAYKILMYDDTIFLGNVSHVDSAYFYFYFRFPPVIKHECIYFCIESQLCDAIFVAFKHSGNDIDWCSFYNIEENRVNFTSVGPRHGDPLAAPWNSFLPSGRTTPATSQLILLGIQIYFYIKKK